MELKISGYGSVEVVSANGTKKRVKQKNKKIVYFVVKAIWPRNVWIFFYKSPIEGPCKHFRRAELSWYGTVRNKAVIMKLTKKAAVKFS